MKAIIITIDGAAASGKGTIAKYLKKKFNFFHIDSGLLYRKVAKIVLDKKINIKNNEEINLLIKKTKNLLLLKQNSLRSSKVSKKSSEIAKIKKIRNFVNLNQKKLVQKNCKKYKGIVIDGRDIGSVVFKDAKIKLYIYTNPKIKAKRRYKELIERGEKFIYSDVLKDIKNRDRIDKNRRNSPLVIPKDAVIINNSGNLLKTKKLVDGIIKTKLEI